MVGGRTSSSAALTSGLSGFGHGPRWPSGVDGQFGGKAVARMPARRSGSPIAQPSPSYSPPRSSDVRRRQGCASWRRRDRAMPRGSLSQRTLTPAEFAAKWRGVTTTEKASSQSHFIDLCRRLGEPTPHDADPTGEQYAFERRGHEGRGRGGLRRRLEARLRHPVRRAGVSRGDTLTRVRRRAPDRGPADGRPW